MRDDSRSILTLYRRLLALRRDYPALSVGDYRGLHLPPDPAGEVLAIERIAEGETLRILLNFGSAERNLALEDGSAWTVLLSTHAGRSGETAQRNICLNPDEGVILGTLSV